MNEYPIYQTPNGKTVEVIPLPQSSLWTINPHGVNTPNYLKGVSFTSAKLAGEAVEKWIETIKEKQKSKE